MRTPPITTPIILPNLVFHLVLSTWHDHLLSTVLLVDDLLALPSLTLLLGLDDTAAQAAAGLQEVGGAVSLEVVFLADVLHLHGLHDPVYTEAGCEVEAQALENVSRGSDRTKGVI